MSSTKAGTKAIMFVTDNPRGSIWLDSGVGLSAGYRLTAEPQDIPAGDADLILALSGKPEVGRAVFACPVLPGDAPAAEIDPTAAQQAAEDAADAATLAALQAAADAEAAAQAAYNDDITFASRAGDDETKPTRRR